MNIASFTFNIFKENTYVVYDETGACVIIDPGCANSIEQDKIDSFIRVQGLSVSLILNTHAHLDHIIGNHYLKQTYQVPLATHSLEKELLALAVPYATQFGFPNYMPVLPDQWLQEGDTISFGNTTLSVLHVPGHSPGHVAFYNEKHGICFAGDVLFKGSIGRTDLPGGDTATLLKSIREQLFVLPPDVTIYPGHGATTTIGYEVETNPFLKNY